MVAKRLTFGTRYTNFEDVNGRHISVPKTAHVTDKRETNIPLKSMIGIKDYIDHVFPSLKPLGINATKLCCQSSYSIPKGSFAKTSTYISIQARSGKWLLWCPG